MATPTISIAAKRRQFDLVLCWKLDRFGRSLRHQVNALAELEAVGVAFVSLSTIWT
jgi:DNA invertase Pin-like site-specific DNA recombinase